MDATTVLVILAMFAVIVIAAFLVFRQRSTVKLKGPFGTGLEVDGTNASPPPKPAVTVEEVKSHAGGIVAEDRTGRGTEMRRAEAYRDIRATSEAGGSLEDDDGPKG